MRSPLQFPAIDGGFPDLEAELENYNKQPDQGSYSRHPSQMRTVVVGDNADFQGGEVVRLIFPAGYRLKPSARVQQRRRSFLQAFAILSSFALFVSFLVVIP